MVAFTREELKTKSREMLINLAQIAECSKRYHDMCFFMEEVVHQNAHLNNDERNLLSIAYKNVVGSHREAWRSVCSELETPLSAEVRQFVEEYKKKIEADLHLDCNKILTLTESQILPNIPEEDSETKVYFLKMCGDYHRYIAETCEENGPKAIDYYKQSYELATKTLAKTNPTRLGLCLNYSVCIYEIDKNPKLACEHAKIAFDDAFAQLETINEEDYKDSTLIMQLLRDNLTVWASESDVALNEAEEKAGDAPGAEGAAAENDQKEKDKMVDDPEKVEKKENVA